MTRSRFQRFVLWVLVSLSIASWPGPAQAESRQVVIGVLAKRGSDQCLQQWAPTAHYLDAHVPGHHFRIAPLEFDQIGPAVSRGQVDFILANPSFYVELEVRHGARRIATLENLHADGTSHKEFAGLLFTRRARTDLQTLTDLKGLDFMAVDEKSLGGWHMAWLELEKAGVDPYKDFHSLEFGGSHDAVVFAVLEGKVDAGAVRSDTIERMALEGKIDPEELRTVAPDEACGGSLHFRHSTRHYPEWPLARAAGTSNELAKQVATALLRMPADDPAAKAARCTGWSPPENYQVVRECLQQLSLPPYEDFGKVTLMDAARRIWPWLLGTILLTVAILLAGFRALRLKSRLVQTEAMVDERAHAWSFVQQILDSLPMGVLLIRTDSRLVTLANPAAASMIGLDMAQIVGRPCRSFFSLEPEGTCPILDDGQERDQTERILQTMDRGPVPILKTAVQVRIDGIDYLLESFLDISDLKATEAERERLALAIDQAGEMIVTTDPQGLIEYVNPAFERITGYPRDEVIGRHMSFLKSEKHDDTFYRSMWDTISRGKTWTGRFLNRRKDGTLFTDDSTITAVRDNQGKIISYVSVKRDITGQLELEQQVRQAQKMETVGRLAGGLAHDYNNMMGVILGYTDILLDEEDLSGEVRLEIEEIQQAAERSARLTRQLLGFARRQTIDPRTLDMNFVLGDMLKMLQRLIGENIALELRACADAWPVRMDPTQVDQIIVNLCVNARDAITDSGQIIIETQNTTFTLGDAQLQPGQAPGDYLTIIVRDDGGGMSPEVLEMVFEPFFTTKQKGQGTGLGLATVYGIVSQNKGFIHLESEEGSGTTVRIHLPRHRQAPDSKKKPRENPPRQKGTETILLVEDEPSLLRAVTGILRMHGYTVLPALQPAEAFELLAGLSTGIDMVISDVVLPGMNGLEFIHRMRDERPGLKYLLVSGYPADAISDQNMPEEEIPFLQKPFSMKDLVARVREILDR